MRTIIILMLAICTVCGCETPQVKDSQIVSSGEVTEVELKGHRYLIFDGYYSGNIIHAEHCPCKNTEH